VADAPMLFALQGSRPFGERLAAALGVSLEAHEERSFEDGEHKSRPLVSVRGRDVYVVHALYGEPGESPNDKLCRLLFFIAVLRECGAGRITAVMPYLCYARKDRRTQPRDPVTTRYVATLLEAAGAARVMTLEVHNPAAWDNAFGCEKVHLEARGLFAAHFRSLAAAGGVTVLSPDIGGVKRAEAFRAQLERLAGTAVELGFMEKRRALGVVSGERLVGEVAGREVIILDDLVSTGTTLARAAAACRSAGARRIQAAASHGLFVGDAEQVLGESALARIVVADTVPPFRLSSAFVGERMEIVDSSRLFAEAIGRLHRGEPLTGVCG